MESQEDEELKQRMRNQVRDSNEDFSFHQKWRKVATYIIKSIFNFEALQYPVHAILIFS